MTNFYLQDEDEETGPEEVDVVQKDPDDEDETGAVGVNVLEDDEEGEEEEESE